MSDPLTQASSDSYYRGLAAAYRGLAAQFNARRDTIERLGPPGSEREAGKIEAWRLAEQDCRGLLAELQERHAEALGDAGRDAP